MQTIKRLITRLFNYYRNARFYYYRKDVIRFLRNKSGLEIGGPSAIFREKGMLPIYSVVKSLDGCNFSCKTIWEGEIEEGNKKYNYCENSLPGRQYICEATDLKSIKSEQYDFVVCAHLLEHLANPLKVIEESTRVLKDGGVIVVVLPDSRYTFDHNRNITDFSHLISDYKNNMGEHDLSHMDEILELHDLSMDLPAGTPEQFRERSLLNYENRCLHQHVFNLDTMKKLADFAGLKVLFLGVATPCHMIGILRKSFKTGRSK